MEGSPPEEYSGAQARDSQESRQRDEVDTARSRQLLGGLLDLAAHLPVTALPGWVGLEIVCFGVDDERAAIGIEQRRLALRKRHSIRLCLSRSAPVFVYLDVGQV